MRLENHRKLDNSALLFVLFRLGGTMQLDQRALQSQVMYEKKILAWGDRRSLPN